MPSSLESVQALKAQGYTHREIADTIQRDPRVISQILSGEKPYRNLEGALSELAGQGSIPVAGPERRQTRTGEQARTRQSERVRTSSGFVHRANNNYDLRRTMNDAARQGRKVKITLTVRRIKRYGRPAEQDAKVEMFQHGGMEASKALDLINDIGGGPESNIGEAMMATIMELSDGQVEEISGFIQAQIEAF